MKDETMVEVSQADFLRLKKQKTRQKTLAAVRAGKLIKRPCLVCGTDRDVHAHHIDYDDPYTVSWVCRDHHVEHHDMLKYSYRHHGNPYLLTMQARVLEYMQANPDFNRLEEIAIECAIPSLSALQTIIIKLISEGFATFPKGREYNILA